MQNEAKLYTLSEYFKPLRRFRKQKVKINGKFNVSKAKVLLSVYVWDRQFYYRGLTRWDIQRYTGLSEGYLQSRLPMFTNAGHKWKHAYLRQKWVIRNGAPVIVYKLTPYGKKWINEKSPRETIEDILAYLSEKWQK